MHGSLRIFADDSELCESLAQLWQEIAAAAIADHGAFHVALAGGGTPRQFYQRLARADYRECMPWQDTQVYFGDERCVPQDHADSNYRMAWDAFLSHVPIPLTHIHPLFDPQLSPAENAQRYARLLTEKLPQAGSTPVFDLVLLGMGEDGHTASLFPNTEILQETAHTVAAQRVDKLDAWRVSLTFPTLNAARYVAVMVAGGAKSEILFRVLKSDTTGCEYPIQCVDPQGKLVWFVDRAAAGRLAGESGS